MLFSRNPAEKGAMLELSAMTKRKSAGLPQLGPNLRALRQRAGLTQKELAERSGVDRATIGQLEAEIKKDTSTATLAPLAEALGVSVHDLVFQYEQPAMEPLLKKLAESPLAKKLDPPLGEDDLRFLRSLGPMVWLNTKPTMLALLLMVEGYRAAKKPDMG